MALITWRQRWRWSFCCSRVRRRGTSLPASAQEGGGEGRGSAVGRLRLDVAPTVEEQGYFRACRAIPPLATHRTQSW